MSRKLLLYCLVFKISIGLQDRSFFGATFARLIFLEATSDNLKAPSHPICLYRYVIDTRAILKALELEPRRPGLGEIL
jgi:hypothetical protein